MSSYTQITKHPQTGVYEKALWIDDYFSPHVYGVKFESDGKVYPVDIVEGKQIYDFWKDDVVNAYLEEFEDEDPETQQQFVVDFLNRIQAQYVARWEEDPLTGNGASVKSKVVKK